jgi:hypothetical protein
MTAKRFLRPFAINATTAADRVQIPDVGSATSAVNYQTGYNSRYSLQYGINPQALPVERQYFNGLIYDVTSTLMDWQLYGFPEWYNYAGTTDPVLSYSDGSVVRYRPSTSVPFVLYRCILDGTVTVPTDTTRWELVPTVAQLYDAMGLVNQYPNVNNVPATGDFNAPPYPTGRKNGIIEFKTSALVRGWLNAPPTQSTAREGVLENYQYTSSTPGVDNIMQRYSDVAGQIYARAYGTSTGRWSPWVNLTLKGGATGAGDDRVFYLNDQAVTASYDIPSNQNAMTAGPITVNNGVTVAIPNGAVWTVV